MVPNAGELVVVTEIFNHPRVLLEVRPLPPVLANYLEVMRHIVRSIP